MSDLNASVNLEQEEGRMRESVSGWERILRLVTSWQQQVDVAIEKDKDPSSPDMR
jgi:hypothetical protein